MATLIMVRMNIKKQNGWDKPAGNTAVVTLYFRSLFWFLGVKKIPCFSSASLLVSILFTPVADKCFLPIPNGRQTNRVPSW